MPERKEVILSGVDAAYIMGVSTRAFGLWDVKAVERKGREVFYNLKDVVAFYKEMHKKKEAPLTSERTRYVKIQADKAESELALYKNEMHNAKLVKNIWVDQILRFRARLLAVPAKLSLPLANVSESHKVEKKLLKEVKEVLEELQEYNASDYTVIDDLEPLKDLEGAEGGGINTGIDRYLEEKPLEGSGSKGRKKAASKKKKKVISKKKKKVSKKKKKVISKKKKKK